MNWRSLLGFNEPTETSVVRQVIKRDGGLEKYNRWKIAAAVSKAVVRGKAISKHDNTKENVLIS